VRSRPNFRMPQGSPQTGHVGSLKNRPYKANLVVEKPAALLPWESKNDSHFPITSTTASSYLIEYDKTLPGLLVSRINEKTPPSGLFVGERYGVTPYGRIEGDP
jgi:hypothetical protein